jgi:hypothetical protein
MRQYADAIYAYSRLVGAQSLYPGTHFRDLGRYVQRPFEVRAPAVETGPGDKNAGSVISEQHHRAPGFMTLCDLDPACPTRVRPVVTIDDFLDESTRLLADSPHPHLVFMSGHASPEWVVAVGSQYRIDPSFWRCRLDFRPGASDHFSQPSLPSQSRSVLHLRATTIGRSLVKDEAVQTQGVLDSIRSQTARRMGDYHEKLELQSDRLKTGDSIVQKMSIHDLRHFTIEQDISLYVVPTRKSWVGEFSTVT